MPVICLFSVLCVFIFQSNVNAVIPLDSHITYRVSLIEKWHNGELVDTNLSLIAVSAPNTDTYKKIEITVKSNEIGSSSLEASLWKEALLVLVRAKGTKYLVGKSTSNNTYLSDRIQITHELYILSPPEETGISIDDKNRSAESTFTIHFVEPKYRESMFSRVISNLKQLHRFTPF